MVTSQNGFIANNEHLIKTFEIPFANRHIRERMGAPGYLLTHLALWFHQEVEPLDQGVWDEWGYAEKPISGSTDLSNHASGTAMDLNATKHPMGVAGTFTAAQQAKIRKRLKLYKGCIRWGGDYQNRKDDMHFEINASLEACQKRWRLLRLTPRGRAIRRSNAG